jgi:hypothetical protein
MVDALIISCDNLISVGIIKQVKVKHKSMNIMLNTNAHNCKNQTI